MNKIMLRPGVVLLRAGGAFLLVADLEARKTCQYVRQINEAAAYYWQLMEAGMSFPEIVACSCEKFHTTRVQQQTNILLFIKKFMEAGYLVEAPQEQ